jgi:hypothetical protein
MEYKVVMEHEFDTFISAVNSNLQDGWRTIGGVAVSPPPDGTGLLFFYQAMVKPAESEFVFGRGD